MSDIPAGPLRTFREQLLHPDDPAARQGFSPAAWGTIASVIFLILLPTLVHPLDADQALFNLNGSLMLHGGVYYRDMIDMKPPLLSAIYALANFLFHAGEHSIRLLDLLLQGIICWLLAALVRRSGGGDLLAATVALCYALLYAGQGYGALAQSEGYAGLFALPMLWLLLFRRTTGGFFLIGLLAGGLWLLKFTLAALLLVPLLAAPILFGSGLRATLRYGTAATAGFVVVAGGFVLVLVAGGAWDEFLLVTGFTRKYAATELQSPGQWGANLLTVFPRHLLLDFSPLFLAAIVMAMLRPGRSPKNDPKRAGSTADLLRACSYGFILMAITIIMEGKYPGYHFIRLFPFGAVLAGAGLLRLAGMIARRSGGAGRGLAIAGACIALLLGPLAYYGWHAILPVGLRLAHGATPEGLARYNFSVSESMELGRYLAARKEPGDKLYVAASIGGLVYYHTGFPPATNIHHFAFVNAVYGPQIWKDSIASYLLAERPRFIVAETTDSYPSITGTPRTSEEGLRALPRIDSLLDAAYEQTLRLPHLEVYERR